MSETALKIPVMKPLSLAQRMGIPIGLSNSNRYDHLTVKELQEGMEKGTIVLAGGVYRYKS